MRLLDLTLNTAAENLALDEALLLATDTTPVLRFWESRDPFVVLGRSSRLEEEVHPEACRKQNVPILRRVSGGATIVTGPGCLMYSVALNRPSNPQSLSIDDAHTLVLGKMVTALRQFDPSVSHAGTSDLVRSPASAPIKFSGNSLRLVRSRLLYHGTLLYDFDLPRIAELLRTPPRQPDYRQGRTHEAFVGNLPAERAALVQTVGNVWNAHGEMSLDASLEETVMRLVAERYTQPTWTHAR